MSLSLVYLILILIGTVLVLPMIVKRDAEMNNWPDAYTAHFGNDGFVRVPFPESVGEAIDDLPDRLYNKWLMTTVDYWGLILDVQRANGKRPHY